MTKTPVSISQLAKYGLDYVGMTSGRGARGRPVTTERLDDELLNIPDILLINDAESIVVELVTSLDDRFNPNTPDEDKSDEQRQAEQRIERDKDILDKLQEINNKIRTDGYTKRVVLQTGFITFHAKRELESERSEEYDAYDAPLIQIPISDITFKFSIGSVTVTMRTPENYVEVLVDPLKNYLPQQYYDTIFNFVTESEAADRTLLPLDGQFLTDLWATIKVQLERAHARSISERPDMGASMIAMTGKSNHFLAEDLKAIAELEDEQLAETSLSSWVSDEDMTNEHTVSDDGSSEIFFPFAYDKYQLKVLGITSNKAVIVEGPPGTGKSQTISNLLVHLASTGQRVLFASQKDQAIRGVKEKLKTLDVPFLFGYIPDKTSKLYTEVDERDSAATTLISLNREFQQGSVSDLREPLAQMADRTRMFVENIDKERTVYELYKERRSLSYLDSFASYEIDEEWYDACCSLESVASEARQRIRLFEAKPGENADYFSKKLHDLTIDSSATEVSMGEIIQYVKTHMPERSGWLGGKVGNVKLRSALKQKGRAIPQEVYAIIETVLFADLTKSSKLNKLESLKKYIAYDADKKIVIESHIALAAHLNARDMPAATFEHLRSIVGQRGKEEVFRGLLRYSELTDMIQEASIYGTNELNREIQNVRKLYRSNTVSFVRNRILDRVSEVNNSKALKATLAQVARSLSKSKKANKTFDRLKHNEDNFDAMSKVIPIWMMSLDDVSRIVPLQKNIFDYVIIDEASQCNFAYAFPAMYRAKHTIFFGDTLQMRDDNIMFKSNDQLNAVAKKHMIPDVYQIKAEEDTVKSVMDIAHLNGFKTATLRYHYRSPRELIGFSNEAFYEPVGRGLEPINDNIVPFKDTGRVMLNHLVSPLDSEEKDAKTNIAEVKKILLLIDEIKNDPALKDKSIAVLTFFNEQAELLRNSIEDEDIKVSVIDGIQGDEKDIIIYSFVIKDPQEKRRYVALTGEGGEIRKDIAAGRVNVAFSRAKLQVHCVTSLPTELWPSGIWIKKYLEYVDKRGTIVRRHHKANQKFDSLFEEQVFGVLANSLPPDRYSLETQVESLGFLIDLVISGGGKKLAIECDGPTHFEKGNGQIYVQNDWERQSSCVAAGLSFWSLSYFEWIDDQKNEEHMLLGYIRQYFGDDNLVVPDKIKGVAENNIRTKLEPLQDAYRHDDRAGHVYLAPEKKVSVGSVKKTASASPEKVNEAEVAVEQVAFSRYLESRIGTEISVRYLVSRAGNLSEWKKFKVVEYDDTYLYVDAGIDTSFIVKFHRDRVLDYK